MTEGSVIESELVSASQQPAIEPTQAMEVIDDIDEGEPADARPRSDIAAERLALLKESTVSLHQIFENYCQFTDKSFKLYRYNLCFKNGVNKHLKLGRPKDYCNYQVHLQYCRYIDGVDFIGDTLAGNKFVVDRGQLTLKETGIDTNDRSCFLKLLIQDKVPFTSCTSESMKGIVDAAWLAGKHGKTFNAPTPTTLKRYLKFVYLNLGKQFKKTQRQILFDSRWLVERKQSFYCMDWVFNSRSFRSIQNRAKA